MSLPATFVEACRAVSRTKASDLIQVTRLRLNVMVGIAVLFGYYMAIEGAVHWFVVCAAMAGTLLVSLGSSVFNQYLEREYDRKMERTHDRPIAAGRMQALEAIVLGSLLSLGGLVFMLLTCELVAVTLSLFALLSYLMIYTPLKRHTTLNTIVGAVPGALPPMIGWAAATGPEGLTHPGIWVIFSIQFLWQMPHFMAIAWLYRDDYKRGGYVMLSTQDQTGHKTARQAVVYAAALLPVSIAPAWFGLTSSLYLPGAFLMSVVFLGYAFGFLRKPNDQAARKLFRASLVYLPLLMAWMAITKL